MQIFQLGIEDKCQNAIIHPKQGKRPESLKTGFAG
jgi:hypothetical protein